MQKREDKYQSQFASADEMVASAIPAGTGYHTVPGHMQINAWLPMLKSLLLFLLFVALAVACKIFLGVEMDVAIGLVAVPFILYALIRGIRGRPDAMAISDDKVWLYTDVVYDRGKKTFSFDEVYEIPKGDIKRCWNFQFFTIKFKVPRQITVKHQQSFFMTLAKYYQHNPINIGAAKQLLFGH